MKAVACLGGLPIENERALVDVELPAPAPRPRDLLVRVHAVSVNPRDIKSRKTSDGTPEAPHILGYDASGVVEATGAECALFKPGDAVFYAGVVNRPGSNAELHAVDERLVGRKPATLDFAAAASLPLTALTAWEMLFDRLRVGPEESESLLMLGGAGGVPSIAIQLARALTKLTVIASASRPESARWVRDLGAHHVIDHTKPLHDEIKTLGVSAPRYVFSTHTDARSWSEIARLIAPQGRLGLIDDPELVDIKLFKPKSASIHWEAMFTRGMFATPDMIRQHEILNEVAGMVDAGRLRATATENFGTINAANLRRAHAAIEGDRTMGKIVLAGF